MKSALWLVLLFPLVGAADGGAEQAPGPPVGGVEATAATSSLVKEVDFPVFDPSPKIKSSIWEYYCSGSRCRSPWFDPSVETEAFRFHSPGQFKTKSCSDGLIGRGFLIGSDGEDQIVFHRCVNGGKCIQNWFSIKNHRIARRFKVGSRAGTMSGKAAITWDRSATAWVKGGTLRSYPSKKKLNLMKLAFADWHPLHVLAVGLRKYVYGRRDGMITVRSFQEGVDQELTLGQEWIDSMVWANPDWLLRSYASSANIWMVSKPDGTAERVLAFGALGSCGQPLMGNYALNLAVEDNVLTVVALSLRPGIPDQRMRGVPLDKMYCVAGEGGIIAVTGRVDNWPAVAIFQDGNWHRITLLPGRSLLEPVVKNGVVLVSAPEEDYIEDIGQIESNGAVYIIRKLEGSWKVQERVLPAMTRQDAQFGFRVLLVGDRLFINYLDELPGRRKPKFNNWGVPSICEVSLAEQGIWSR